MPQIFCQSSVAGMLVWAKSGLKHPVERQRSKNMPNYGFTHARADNCPMNMAVVGETTQYGGITMSVCNSSCMVAAVCGIRTSTLESSPAQRLDNGTFDPTLLVLQHDSSTSRRATTAYAARCLRCSSNRLLRPFPACFCGQTSRWTHGSQLWMEDSPQAHCELRPCRNGLG
jgi:hypothetical protein